MKKAVSLLTLISLIASVFVLPSCSLLGLALDAEHFPDKELRYSLRSFDSNGNGYLSKKELKEAKSLLIWGDCYDLTGIEYLTNLECSKESAFNVGDLSSVPGLGRCPGGRHGNPL